MLAETPVLRIPTASHANSVRALSLLFLLIASCRSLTAQQPCQPVHIPSSDPRSNIFSDRQEMDVGDAIAEHVQREFLVIDDPDYTGYVQRVGQKLLAHAPPTDLRIQFFLSDWPVANALSLPGGRVYVFRKLVAITRNEGELARELSHDLAHGVTQ